MKFEPIDGVDYRYNYNDIFSDIAANKFKSGENATIRALILTDLWFLINFILKIPNANNPYVVKQCQTVEYGPKSLTLDIWFRGGWKSTIITIGETIQYALKFPEESTAIICYKKELAEKFLRAIKGHLTNNSLLHRYFPDILYANPERESPLWAVDKGIIVKRSNNSPEPTVAAYGLVDNQPTGIHPDRIVYDDMTTHDLCVNSEISETIKVKFDMSRSFGKDGGTHRVIGTPYAYDDPLSYIESKTMVGTDKPLYMTRKQPVTEDGTRNGKSVYYSQEYLDTELKILRTFDTQYLLNPSPDDVKKLDKDKLKIIGIESLPERLYKFLIVDPAGKKGTGDPWAIVVVGVKPNFVDVRASDIYILSIVQEKYRLEEAIRKVVQTYKEHGKICLIGVEEVAQSTTTNHIASELKLSGINVSVDRGTIQIYNPSKRAKIKRIEEIVWPLDNGRLYILNTILSKYIEITKSQMFGFPNTNDDHILDILSYFIADTLPEYKFTKPSVNYKPQKPIPIGAFT